MKKDSKKEDKMCFILHTITSLLFTFTGVSILKEKGFVWTGITNIALGVTFGSLAYIYYKKYKEVK